MTSPHPPAIQSSRHDHTECLMQLMPPVPVDNLVAVAGKAPGILHTTAGSHGQLEPHNSRGCDPVVLWTRPPTSQWALTSTLQGMRPGACRNGTCLHSNSCHTIIQQRRPCALSLTLRATTRLKTPGTPYQPHDKHSAPTQLPPNLTKIGSWITGGALP